MCNYIQGSLMFLGNLICGAVIAFITVRLALRRFYSEKWWERKSEAYTAIFESLHHIRNHADHNLMFFQRHIEIPEEGRKELTEKLQGAIAELRKLNDIGSFLVSKEAVSALAVLFNELDKSTEITNWEKHLQLKLQAVDKCLETMRIIAKKDLSLK
jgi:hypothetical protein